ncbi:MAG: DUF3179 domain-containing (seleno)protein [Anaerolineae bacterium]
MQIELTLLPPSLVSFAGSRQAYPEGIVFSRDTGYSRDRGRNPLPTATGPTRHPSRSTASLMALAAMERVVTVSPQDVDVAYPLSMLSEMHVVDDTPAGVDLVVWHVPGTSRLFIVGL